MTRVALRYHPHTHPPRRRKAIRANLAISVWLGMLVGCGLFTGLTIMSSSFYFYNSDRILPGVRVQGSSLGLMTAGEAEQAIRETWQRRPAEIQLIDGERTWQISAAELGITIDAPRTVRRALSVGRESGLPGLIGSPQEALEVDPAVVFDDDAARQTLTRWAATANLPAQDAGFRIEGGQVVSVPSQTGRELDVELTLNVLLASPEAVLKNRYLPLLMRPVAPRIADVSAVAAQAARLLAEPHVLNAYDPVTDELQQWTVTPQVIATWLVPGPDGGSLSISEDKLNEYVAGQNAALGNGRYIDTAQAAGLIRDALQQHQSPTLYIRHSPTVYVVQPGDSLTQIGWNLGIPYWRIVQANPGLESMPLYAGMELVIPSKDDLLPLPIVPGKRIVVSLGQQRAWIFQDRQLRREFVISTGIDRSPTQPGVFQVQTHEPNAYASIWNLWMPHFLGIYESWPGFTNGFHGLPMLASGRRLWADVLGRQASYGCIILSLEDAEMLYNWADNGVVVEIRP